MANNRMFIYHTKTGECFYLARSHGELWGIPCGLMDEPCIHYIEELQKYFDKNSSIESSKEAYQWGDTSFKIGYEIEENDNPLDMNIKLTNYEWQCNCKQWSIDDNDNKKDHLSTCNKNDPVF